MHPEPASVKLSFVEKFGYGLGDTASNFVWALMMNFIMFYYTDIFGITAAAAGTMLLFARSTDGVVDFFIGAIADRTKSKWGRFRPYLVWLCVPLAVVFVLAFTTPNLSPAGKLVWAWVTYNLLMLLYSAINIPYGALSGVMTDDPLERTSLNCYRMSLAQIGGIIANSSFMVLIVKLGGGHQTIGAQRTVMLFSAVAIVLFLSLVLDHQGAHSSAGGAKDQPAPGPQDPLPEPSLDHDVRHRHHQHHLGRRARHGGYLLPQALPQMGWRKRIGTYFPRQDGLAMIFGAMMTRFAVKAIGKKWSFITSLVLVALTAVPFYLIKPDQTALVYTFQILGMIFAGINATLFWAMVADTADFQEWKYKVRTTGVAFSATTCAQKAGMGIGAAFAGFLDLVFRLRSQGRRTDAAKPFMASCCSTASFPPSDCLLLSGFFTHLRTERAYLQNHARGPGSTSCKGTAGRKGNVNGRDSPRKKIGALTQTELMKKSPDFGRAWFR